MNYRIYFENVLACDACELADMLSLEYRLDYQHCLDAINEYINYYYTFTISDMIDFIDSWWAGNDFYRTVFQSIIDSIHAGELPEAFLVRP